MDIDLNSIEKLMSLLTQYKCDSITLGNVIIAKSKHDSAPAVLTQKDIIEKHLSDGEIQDDEDEAAIEAWSRGQGLMPLKFKK